jgi:peptidoglycan/LPS O-acetylase OafA/YrhL
VTGNRRRLEDVDALRGFAALAVLLYHYFNRYDELYGHAAGVPRPFALGDYGVQLFFMISGFVIVLTLQRCRSAADFAVLRFSRLFPSYWVCLTLTAVVGLLAPLPDQALTARQIGANLTMVQGWFHVRDVDGVYWTLTLELGFYLVMAALFACGLLRRLDRVLWPWLVLCVLYQLWPHAISERSAQMLALPYGHLFIAGIALHLLWRRGAVTPAPVVLMALCLALEAWVDGIAAGLVAVALAALFAAAVWERLPLLRSPPCLWLGRISYPLYLIHQMIGYRVIRTGYALQLPPLVSIFTALVLALALASAVNRLVEEPVLTALRRAWRRAAPGERPSVSAVAS